MTTDSQIDAEFSCEHHRDGYCQRAADYIARAIMGERERCAEIARANTTAPRIWQDGRWLAPAAEEIAGAILKGDE